MSAAPPPTGAAPAPSARAGTIPVMALACGVTVANIYLCQPLLAAMAKSLGASEQAVGLVAMAAQVGYALGILFIVPLADVTEPRRLVRILLAVTTAMLLVAGAAPGLPVLIVASAAVAAATVVPQVLIPLAAALAPPNGQARVIGALQTGLVLGILLSRTASGAVTAASGSWRAPYFVAAVCTLALFVALPPFLPRRDPDRPRQAWGALLRSMAPLLALAPMRLSMVLGFTVLAAFAAVWATLAFHLSGDPFHLGVAAIGLFGLWGAPGALLAPRMGRLADRWGSAAVNAVGLGAVSMALALAAFPGRWSPLALVLAVNLLDFGLQSGHIANQTRVFALGDTIRGRTNTLYMVSSFSGGACGSVGGTLAWSLAGWDGVCALAFAFVGVGALALAFGRGATPRG